MFTRWKGRSFYGSSDCTSNFQYGWNCFNLPGQLSWLEHLAYIQGVVGSSPAGPTKTIFEDIHYKNLTVMVGYRILIVQDVEYLRCITISVVE